MTSIHTMVSMICESHVVSNAAPNEFVHCVCVYSFGRKKDSQTILRLVHKYKLCKT